MEWIINNLFLLVLPALCIGMHFLAGHRRHGKYSDEEVKEHSGHKHADSPDGSHAKKGHSCCH